MRGEDAKDKKYWVEFQQGNILICPVRRPCAPDPLGAKISSIATFGCITAKGRVVIVALGDEGYTIKIDKESSPHMEVSNGIVGKGNKLKRVGPAYC